MGIQISPYGNSQFLAPSGTPAIGYKLFVFEARSTNKAIVYGDRDGLSRHTNPIILGEHGFSPLPIYIDTAKSYKFVLAFPEDLDDQPTMPLYVVDQVSIGINTPTVSTPEWSTGTTPTYVGAAQFSVTGNQTAVYHVGRRVKLTTDGGNLYGTITASTFSSVTTVMVALDSGSIDSTISAVYYSFLSASGSSWPGGYNSGLTTIFSGPVTVALNSAFNLIPVGTIFPFAQGVAPPPGFYLCDGSPYSRTGNAALFAAIGTTFGTGDGSTTFNVPDIDNLDSNVPYIIRYA